jgi:hypothetical protein
MSLGNWLHLIVMLQIPGGIVGWLGARSAYRSRRR